MSVFMVCERAIGLIRGNRLILTPAQRDLLEALDYEGIVASKPDKEEVVSCVLHFADVRDSLLRKEAWVFARKTAMLAQRDTSVEGWPYSYSRPNDCLRILALIRRGFHGDRIVEKWEETGDVVSCLYPVTEMRYTGIVSDTDDWDPLFREAFCYSLAAAIVGAVTGEPALYQNMEQGAQLRIEEARRCGAIKKPLSIRTEMYAFQGLSDRLDPRYSDGEWW